MAAQEETFGASLAALEAKVNDEIGERLAGVADTVQASETALASAQQALETLQSDLAAQTAQTEKLSHTIEERTVQSGEEASNAISCKGKSVNALKCCQSVSDLPFMLFLLFSVARAARANRGARAATRWRHEEFSG